MLPRKTAIVIGTLAALALLTPNGLSMQGVIAAFALRLSWPEPSPVKPAAPIPQQPPPGAGPTSVIEQPFLVVPSGSLDSFFTALNRVEAHEQGSAVRILHYGDSPTTADLITSDIRALLQRRFGDAGHGFLLIAKPWAWYGHQNVELSGKGWQFEPASQSRAKDGIHGLGGVSFRGDAGASSTVKLPDEQHTRATVHYLEQPDGGTFTVSSSENVIATINTRGEEKKPAFAEFALPPGTQSIELRVTTGHVRLFGYRFDKDQTGVQYSSIGVNGAQIQMMLRYFEPAQWAAELQHENPDLVILNYGTNESVYPQYVDKGYPEELRKVIVRVRAALPKTSILIMSPMDRGALQAGDIVTPPILTKIVAVQKQIAAETGCAFYDTFDAMGGAGTMGRWYREQPRLVSADFMHPLPQGAAKVGAQFEQALVSAWESSRR